MKNKQPKPLACPKHNRILIGKDRCMDCQSPPPPSLRDRSEKESEVKKTDKLPEVTKILREAMKHAHAVGKSGGTDMDFSYNEKLQTVISNLLSLSHHQYAEELKKKINKERIVGDSDYVTGYDEAIDDVLSLLERKGEK